MLHIWHEDDMCSATTTFWEQICKNRGISVDIKGFGGNNVLRKYLETVKINIEDNYIIFVDLVPDNTKVLEIYEAIVSLMSSYNNVVVADLLCFEYLLLKFRYLNSWVGPLKQNKGYSNALTLRRDLIDCLNNKKGWNSNSRLATYATSANMTQRGKVTFETLATNILHTLTNANQNKGFLVRKSNLGTCWYCDCVKTKICNKCKLNKSNRTSCDKLDMLYKFTVASDYID